MIKLVKTTIAAALLLVSVLMPAAIAEGVTPAPMAADAVSLGSVTTGLAVRARADVQIRRIKNLIVSRASTPGEEDAAYERLEKLQKELRGER